MGRAGDSSAGDDAGVEAVAGSTRHCCSSGQLGQGPREPELTMQRTQGLLRGSEAVGEAAPLPLGLWASL